MRSIYYFLKYNRYIKSAIKYENLLDKLRYLFGNKEFKMDWVGRIYTIINPNVDNLNSDGNTIIYDDNTPVIEKWLMDNLNIMTRFLTTNNLFDLLTYKIDKIDDDDNYLVVFQNIYYDSAKKSLKWILGVLGILGIITLILLIIF